MCTTDEQTEVDVLNIEYKAYIEKLKREWRSENYVRSNNVYEVMDSREREGVHARINQWARYITPFAETWWKERGYEVLWPDDSSKPMLVRKLKTG
jgi:hypothetical protein